MTEALGEPIETGIPALNRLGVTADRVADAASPLARLGVPHAERTAIVALARAVADRKVHLEPGSDVPSTLRSLTEGCGMGERTAKAIVLRALHWPTRFRSRAKTPARRRRGERARAAALAERWRPWRAYAATHLQLHLED